MFYLGHMVCEGVGGIQKNTAEGRMFLREASDRGHHEAAADLVASQAPKKGGFGLCCAAGGAASTEWIGPTINMTAKQKLVVPRSDEAPVVVRPFEPMETPVATAVIADDPDDPNLPDGPGASTDNKNGMKIDAVGAEAVDGQPSRRDAPPDDDLGEWVNRFNAEGSSTTSMAARPKEPLPPPPAAASDPADLSFLENDQSNCFVDFSFAFCGKRDAEKPKPATTPENLFGDNGDDYEETDHLVDDEIPMSYVCAPNC